MALYSSDISRLRSTSLAKQRSRLVASIHILDDDSLLNMFHFYRPVFLGEDEKDVNRLLGGTTWARGRWWYQLAHVCQRWRNIILHSASYLRLSLVCTNGAPVGDMLAHSPPLPLTIDYTGEDGIAAEDEDGIFLALEQRHRVRDLRLVFPVQNLNRLVMAIDEEFPILENLIMYPPVNDNTPLRLSGTLQTPHLRHLTLRGFACVIRSGLHPTAAGLVTLCLTTIQPSAFYKPDILLQSISFMPQLESLEIAFQSPIRNRDLERQLTHTPITTHITLPNLRLFWFRGDSAYLEAVVCRITTPRLENLRIRLFNQLMFSLPRLGQFMNTTENLRFDNAVIKFKDKEIDARISSLGADTSAFSVTVECWHLDWQVPVVAQISNGLTQVLSAVEDLTLEHEVHSQSSEEHNDVDRIELRNLLRLFNNVKNLRVEDGLVKKLSHCLGLEDGEDPLELLPELQVLNSGSFKTGEVFTSFIDSRQKAGRPVTLMNGAMPQFIQSNTLPALSEDRFNSNFRQFARSKGIRLTERDLVIDGRRINLWALHRAVFSRNGFDQVTSHDEWPVIGAALGFPPVGGDPGRPSRCGPVIAQRLQQLYNDVLRHFDQIYISSIVARLRSLQAELPPQPPQPQTQPHQPTEADYQALLASITSETSVLNTETMSILPRFSHTSGAELEAHFVPQHVITFVEQNREHLQRAAQDQNGFRAALTSTKNAPLDNRNQVNHTPALQALGRARQFIPGHQQPRQLQRQGLVQAPGMPNTLQSAQLFNSGPLVPPSTAQTMNASSMQSMGTQIPGSSSNSGVQNQGTVSVSVSMSPAAINGVTSGPTLTQPAFTMQVRLEDLAPAKRWVEERKRMAFSSVPNFDRVAPIQSIPESDIQEYRRNLEHLDQVLVGIEKYIHFGFAALKKGEIVERLFRMMVAARSQLEELKKPIPRSVLELHTIRGMIREAENMDKGLKVVLQKTQLSQPPSPSTSTLFAQSVVPTAPPATASVSRPPRAPLLQPAHRKKSSKAQVISTPPPLPLPIPVASTSTPQANIPSITYPSPQTPKSPKGKAASKAKPPARRKATTKAASVEMPTPAHTVGSTLTSSTALDGKRGTKRAHEGDTDAPTPGVTSTPFPKRVKVDWEGLANEDTRKHDQGKPYLITRDYWSHSAFNSTSSITSD